MGGSSGGNTTTRTEPPKYQLPYLQGSLSSAQNLYNQQSGTQGVAPLSNESQQALTGITNLATGGNTVNQAGSNLAMQTLNGGFMGANPYLDDTFNRAAMATQGQLASQFAGSGRNVDQSEGNRAQQLNDLSSQIYGGAYNQERDRMQQALLASPQLGQAQYGDLNQLAQVGASREGYQQELLDAPGNALDQYIGRISGNMGQTLINSGGSRNRAAGALGGAMAGYNMFQNPWGAIGGGILGGIF